jgi:hypothetical protein
MRGTVVKNHVVLNPVVCAVSVFSDMQVFGGTVVMFVMGRGCCDSLAQV